MGNQTYLDEQKIATIACPFCKKVYRKDLSQEKGLDTCLENMDRCLRLRCYCACGHCFVSLMERRRHHRKSTEIPGEYQYDSSFRGIMTIKNLSVSGAGFEADAPEPEIETGAEIILRFNLDDALGTPVHRDAVVRTANGRYVGAEFTAKSQEGDTLDSFLQVDPDSESSG